VVYRKAPDRERPKKGQKKQRKTKKGGGRGKRGEQPEGNGKTLCRDSPGKKSSTVQRGHKGEKRVVNRNIVGGPPTVQNPGGKKDLRKHNSGGSRAKGGGGGDRRKQIGKQVGEES